MRESLFICTAVLFALQGCGAGEAEPAEQTAAKTVEQDSVTERVSDAESLAIGKSATIVKANMDDGPLSDLAADEAPALPRLVKANMDDGPLSDLAADEAPALPRLVRESRPAVADALPTVRRDPSPSQTLHLVLSSVGGLHDFDDEVSSVHILHRRAGRSEKHLRWVGKRGQAGVRVWNTPVTLQGVAPTDTLELWLEGVPLEARASVRAGTFLEANAGEPKDVVMVADRDSVSGREEGGARRLTISNVPPEMAQAGVEEWVEEQLSIPKAIRMEPMFEWRDNSEVLIEVPGPFFEAALELNGMTMEADGRKLTVEPVGSIQPIQRGTDWLSEGTDWFSEAFAQQESQEPGLREDLPASVQLTFFRLDGDRLGMEQTDVVLIRHGESTWNEGTEGGLKEGLLKGGYATVLGKDHPLSTEGWDQCFQGSEEADVIDAVGDSSLLLASPLQRATGTGLVFFRRAMQQGRRMVLVASAREKRGSVRSRDCHGAYIGPAVVQTACQGWVDAAETKEETLAAKELCQSIIASNVDGPTSPREAALEAGQHLFFRQLDLRPSPVVYTNDAAQPWWSTRGDGRRMADRLAVLAETLLLSEHSHVALAAHSLLFRELFQAYGPDSDPLLKLCKMANAKAVSIRLARGDDGAPTIVHVEPVSGGNVLKRPTPKKTEQVKDTARGWSWPKRKASKYAKCCISKDSSC